MAGTDLIPANNVALISTLEIWRDVADLAKAIAPTEFVPKGLRDKPMSVLACMLKGREVGLPEMAALGLIHVIEGRPTMAAEAMRALVLSKGHELWEEEYTNSRVTLCGSRTGSDRVSKVTWTLDDAKRANLAAKDNWRKYPRAMLLARSTGELCRMIFADVLGGISYTIEEIEDGIIDAASEEVDPSSGDPAKPITRKASPARKTAAKKASAPPAARAGSSEPPLPPLPGEDETTPDATDDEAKPEQAELGDDAGDDPNVMERSKSIAIACQRAGLDDDGRHWLIEFITNGRVKSSKEVTAEEGADTLQVAHDIANGRASLIEGDDGWEVVYSLTPPPEEEDATGDGELVGDESGWSGEEWRALLKERGVKVTPTIQQAQKIAGELDLKPPTALDQLAGQGELCSRLRAWVEEQSES